MARSYSSFKGLFTSKVFAYFSIGLLLLSVVSGLLSLASPAVISPGPLGFFSDLTPFYVIGFGACIAALVVTTFGKGSNAIVLMQFAMLEFYLWVIPQSIMPGLRFPAAAHDLFFYSSTASISSRGFIQPLVYQYQSWPVTYIFAAIVKLVLGHIGYLQIYHLAPLLLNSFVALVLYCLFREYLQSSRAAVIGALIFELFDYTEQFTTVSPFAMGSLLFYVYVSMMLISWVKGNELSSRHLIIFFIFAAAISATHPVIAVEMVVASFAVFFLLGIRRPRVRGFSFLYLTVGLMAIILWAMFGARELFATYSSLLYTLFRFSSGIVSPAVNQLTTGTSSHLLVDTARFAVLAVMAVLALPSMIRHFRRNEKVRVLLSFAVGIMASAVFLGGVEGSSFYILLLSAVLPVLLILDLMTLVRVPPRILGAVLLLGLVLSAPVSILVVYGNLPQESVSDPTLSAGVYYSRFAVAQYALGSTTLAQYDFLGFYGGNLATLVPYTNNGITLESAKTVQPQFVVLGSTAQSYANSTFILSTEQWITHYPAYGSVYSSGYETLFSLLEK